MNKEEFILKIVSDELKLLNQKVSEIQNEMWELRDKIIKVLKGEFSNH